MAKYRIHYSIYKPSPIHYNYIHTASYRGEYTLYCYKDVVSVQLTQEVLRILDYGFTVALVELIKD